MEATQQNLFSKLEIIQNYFQEVNQSLENIDFKEREATTTRITFQKEFVSSSKEEISVTPRTPRLIFEEKIRGDIILKTWEANIAESKRVAKEIKEDCEEMFYLLNKGSLSLRNDDCSEVLGHINIVKHQLDIKEGLETAQVEISQLNHVDIYQIDRWIV